MSNLPPMPVRAFRDGFLREDRDGDGGNVTTEGKLSEAVAQSISKDRDVSRIFGGGIFVRVDHDPYERCDFDEEDE